MSDNTNDVVFALDLNEILPTEEQVTKFAILEKNKETLIKILADDTTDQKFKELEVLCSGLNIDFDAFINSIIVYNLFMLANSNIEIGEENND